VQGEKPTGAVLVNYKCIQLCATEHSPVYVHKNDLNCALTEELQLRARFDFLPSVDA